MSSPTSSLCVPGTRPFPSVPAVRAVPGALAVLAVSLLASCAPLSPRTIVSLDGPWQIEEGGLDEAPAAYSRTVPVPGLVDMASPAFEEVGKKSPRRQGFWYRRTFQVPGEIPAVARLKIHKARYGTKVLVNGQLAGEHLPCFTPAILDVKPLLRGGGEENEIVVRVGADRESLPAGMPTGWDFEKYLFIPGIPDSVELILSGEPHIASVQVVPDVRGKRARVVARIEGGTASLARVEARVVEARSGRLAGAVTEVVPGEPPTHATPQPAAAPSPMPSPAPSSGPPSVPSRTVDITVPLEGCHLWSPEGPFLYEVELSTREEGGPSSPAAGDSVRVRFGMRSFRFEGKRALLNERPYYLRGSNVCIYRFFEDAERGDRPWRAEWVRRLHEKFKSMHWNSLRYCIGFPPEIWYEIADEEGFLIEDEFPIWLLGEAPEKPRAEMIAPQYAEWMRERWNHPSVVIWDAQNESFTEETGKAIGAVRGLDLSGRPWENGWGEPQAPTDCVESHPYLFIRGWMGQAPFRLSEMAKVSGVPALQDPQRKLDVAVIINEYGWLWLDRLGNPTCLTDKIYAGLLGPSSTPEARRLLYARYLAALTEFWRCHRECAGVLHFCGLGYSRPGDRPRPEGGATSDHFIDVEELELEPHFVEYVRDAFHPVGIMVDFWDDEVPPGAERDVRVFAINDLESEWKGKLLLRILREETPVWEEAREVVLGALGREIPTFRVPFPTEPGAYVLEARIPGIEGRPVRSLRDFEVAKSPPR